MFEGQQTFRSEFKDSGDCLKSSKQARRLHVSITCCSSSKRILNQVQGTRISIIDFIVSGLPIGVTPDSFFPIQNRKKLFGYETNHEWGEASPN